VGLGASDPRRQIAVDSCRVEGGAKSKPPSSSGSRRGCRWMALTLRGRGWHESQVSCDNNAGLRLNTVFGSKYCLKSYFDQ
jgi:hypothetical protein